ESTPRGRIVLLGWAVAHTLFVYGTLLSGESNHHVLAGSTPLGPARTAAAFELVEFGAYLALVEGGKRRIEGELYVVDDAFLETLDRFEGHPWLYKRGRVALDDGRQVEAYLVERKNLGRARVVEGTSFRTWSKRAAIAFALAMGFVGQASAERHRDAGSDARAA